MSPGEVEHIYVLPTEGIITSIPFILLTPHSRTEVELMGIRNKVGKEMTCSFPGQVVYDEAREQCSRPIPDFPLAAVLEKIFNIQRGSVLPADKNK